MNTLCAQTISIIGNDALAFAHAQFASHVDTLARGRWQFSAWLDAQGRVRSLFHLARTDDDQLLCLLRGGDAGVLAEALRHYVFRAKVQVTANPAASISTAAPRPMHSFVRDDETLVFGCGDHALRLGGAAADDDEWRALQWHAGWPWLPAQALDAWLPPALSLARLQAVVTDKGCYPGQEIVARLHFRGGHKRHLHSAILSGAVPAGTRLRSGDTDIGQVLDVSTAGGQAHALVVLTDSAAASATDGRLDVQTENLSITLRTRWPD